MLRWPVRSALYIDFENVPLQPEAVVNWLAWLEDGQFDSAGRRRRFLVKRVYWNSHAERHRATFERHGISAILIGKYSGLKNGADIRMAMDVLEATYTRPEIGEFILLTGDSDFVPVLERLREKSKRTAIVATEHRPNIHTTYNLHADLLIPSRRLGEASQYRSARSGFWGRWSRSPAAAAPSPKPEARAAARGGSDDKAAARPVVAGPAKPAAAAREAPAAPGPAPRPAAVAGGLAEPAIASALERVVRLMAQQPHNFVAQRRIMAELDRVAGFKRQGPDALLGFPSYRALMKELAAREPRIRVVEQPGGGTGVVFVPPGSKPAVEAGVGSEPPIVLSATATASRPPLPSEPEEADAPAAPVPPPVAAIAPRPMAGVVAVSERGADA